MPRIIIPQVGYGADAPQFRVWDVRARQVIFPDSAVQAAFEADAFSDAFQTGGTQPVHLSGGGDGGDPPDDGGVAGGEFPDGDPRGIDGEADWDSMGLIDDVPTQTIRADGTVSGGSTLYSPTIIVGPPAPPPMDTTHTVASTLSEGVEYNESVVSAASAGFTTDAVTIPNPEIRFRKVEADLKALQAHVAVIAPTVNGIGHNRPPTPIDPEPLYTAKDVADLVAAIAAVRQQPPAPPTVPIEAEKAQSTFRRLLQRLEEGLLWGLGGWGALELIGLLKNAIHSIALWMEAVNQLARMAGH